MAAEYTGQTIGKYRVEQRLGGGGMGVVYRAIDETLERSVAIKIMRPHLFERGNFQKRFLQEAKTLAKLDHPGVVEIYDSGIEQGILYMVMEYLSGGSLQSHLRKLQGTRQQYDLRETLKLVADSAEALALAHRRNIIHRDIKPDNIMLKQTEYGDPPLQAVVTDFGLVKLMQGGGLKTEVGTVMGTIDYMSPEQCIGEELDGRSDVYSLGVVLYQAVTGRVPFQTSNLSVAIRSHTEEAPPPPTIYRPNLPDSVQRIIERCLEKHPDDRYRTADDMARALRAATENLVPERHSLHYFDSSLGGPGAVEQIKAEPDKIVIAHRQRPPETFELTTDNITIGRLPENDLPLDADKVSRYHARLERTVEGWKVIDLGSSNGTRLDGNKLLPDIPHLWNPNAKIRIGPFQLRFVASGPQQNSSPAAAVTPPVRPPQPAEPFGGGGQSVQIVQGGPSMGPPIQADSVTGEPVADDNSQLIVTTTPSSLFIKLEKYGVGTGNEIQVQLVNQTGRVDHFTIEVEGIPYEWVKIPRDTVQLLPNGSESILVIMKPPRASRTRAGRYRYQIHIRARSSGTRIAAKSGQINIAPFDGFSAELHPPRINNGQSVRLILANEGNDVQTYTLFGRDPAEELLFTGNGREISIDPGDDVVLKMEINAKRRPWLGQKVLHDFNINISGEEGNELQSLPGRLTVSPRLPAWFMPAMGMLLIAAVLGISLLFRKDGQEATATAQAATADAQAAEIAALATNQEATLQAINAEGTASALERSMVQTREKENEIATINALRDEQDEAERAQQATADAEEREALATIDFMTVDAGSDTDGDSLTKLEEERLGTDPNLADTDGDGLSDFDEVRRGTSPITVDSDGDTLGDGEEVMTLKTNPRLADSDGDGVPDNIDNTPQSPSTPIPPIQIPTPAPQIINNGGGNNNNNSGGGNNNNSGSGNNSGNGTGNSSGAAAGNGAVSSGGGGTPIGQNLLPNASFEGGFALQDGVQEYQLPVGWRVEDVQDNVVNQFGFTYLKPEIRTLSKGDLPPDEQALFITDGNFAVKMFKGFAPMQATFITEAPITLTEGEYVLTVRFFADIVASFDGGKQFHSDPNAAKVRGVFGGQQSDLQEVAMGAQNEITFPFSVSGTQAMRVGLLFQANFEGSNNGWFIDNWSLVRTE